MILHQLIFEPTFLTRHEHLMSIYEDVVDLIYLFNLCVLLNLLIYFFICPFLSWKKKMVKLGNVSIGLYDYPHWGMPIKISRKRNFLIIIILYTRLYLKNSGNIFFFKMLLSDTMHPFHALNSTKTGRHYHIELWLRFHYNILCFHFVEDSLFWFYY